MTIDCNSALFSFSVQNVATSDKFLTELCEATGGEAFFTGDILALEKAFTKISKELTSQYIITYRPANQNYDGRERKIEVKFTNKEKADKYQIRTKRSYRAVKDSLKSSIMPSEIMRYVRFNPNQRQLRICNLNQPCY